MKRKSIAIALTGALALPLWTSAMALEVYGKAHGSIDFSSNDDEAAGNDDSTIAFTNNASRIGFRGDEQISDDLIVTYQAETTFNLDSGGWGGGRNTFVGLKGGFGEVRAGLHDTPYKMATYDIFNDTRADYNAIIGNVAGNVLFDRRSPNSVLYLSPDMSGFQVQAAYIFGIAAGDDDLPDQEDPDNTGISVAALYNQGPLSLSLALETYGFEGGTVGGFPGGTTLAADDDAKSVKVGASWDFQQGTKVYAIFESSDSGVTDVKRDAFYLSATQQLGENTTLKAALGQADDIDAVDESGASFLALGISQKMSKDTELYALITGVSNDDNADYTLVGVGAPAAATGPTVSAISFGIIKNFSGKFM
jgi:predicted porin